MTSRTLLTGPGVTGVAAVGLGVMPDEAGLALLAAHAGQDRVAREPEAARRLVAACAGLPLALIIAGARLASRPDWRLADLVDRLEDESHRLDELSVGGLRLRSTLELTHSGLAPGSVRLFGLLSLPAFPRLPTWAAGALVGDARSGDDALAGLLETHLLTTRSGRTAPAWCCTTSYGSSPRSGPHRSTGTTPSRGSCTAGWPSSTPPTARSSATSCARAPWRRRGCRRAGSWTLSCATRCPGSMTSGAHWSRP